MIEKSEHDTKTNKKENNLDSSNLSQCESSSEEEVLNYCMRGLPIFY